MIDSSELIDNDFLRQFEIKIDNHLAKIEYSLQDRKIFLTKLVIPEGINDENFIKEFLSNLITNILDDLRFFLNFPAKCSFILTFHYPY